MKNIYLLGYGVIMLGLVGCGTTKSKDKGIVDLDGDLVSEAGESGKGKKKRGLRRLGKDKDPVPEAVEGEMPGEEGLVAEPTPPTPPVVEEKEDLESMAAKALKDAKLHYELGDYDFAADELRSIGANSPYYHEAQQMLKLLR